MRLPLEFASQASFVIDLDPDSEFQQPDPEPELRGSSGNLKVIILVLKNPFQILFLFLTH